MSIILNTRFKTFLSTSAIAALAFVASDAASAKTAQISQPGASETDRARTNQFWWPNLLDLSPLRDHDKRSNPYGANFDYAKEFAKIDLEKLKNDIQELLTDEQDWWPADFGNYGPFFIRMAWHSAGTYRTLDGRGGGAGGQMRFEPLNSWPDNGNLDKARRLLWPIKKKYGRSLSWGDLMILAGNVSLTSMGFETYGFAGGRADDWEPDLVYWGPELEMLASDREDKNGELQKPLGATHMGLIYVNPEGPKGQPDPAGSAKHIRIAFSRMAMNDEETVALIAGGHTFGKMHGAKGAQDCVGSEPAASPIEAQGLGWKNKCGKGHSEDTITSGLEGAWTQAPTKWTTLYLSNLLNFEWEQTKSPAGAIQWVPKDRSLHNLVPDAHVEGKMNPPVMTTADLALKVDPAYRKIAQRFLENPDQFQKAFARAWYKLTHRDMGPRSRYLGKDVPADELPWQDPLPKANSQKMSPAQIEDLKTSVLKSGVTVSQLVRTAWAAASTFRASDLRGGANGARLLLAPQKNWPVNDPKELKTVLEKLKTIQRSFNRKNGEGTLSMADLIVLAGTAAVEKAAADAGIQLKVEFTPGRVDATQQQTDESSFAPLEPTADAFRNYYNQKTALRSPTEMLIDKADQLNLTAPEMTVLIGGLRVLGAQSGGNQLGAFTNKPGTLTNDFFVNLLDMNLAWTPSQVAGVYEGKNRLTGKVQFKASPVDLIFGANSELRSLAEVYASDDAREEFAHAFGAAWTKVMQLDRFDLHHDL